MNSKINASLRVLSLLIFVNKLDGLLVKSLVHIVNLYFALHIYSIRFFITDMKIKYPKKKWF